MPPTTIALVARGSSATSFSAINARNLTPLPDPTAPKGVFWGGLLVQTFGGASEDLAEKGLNLDDAKLMAEQLKACLKD